MDKKLLLNRINAKLMETESASTFKVSIAKRKCTGSVNVIIEKIYENGASFRVFNRPVEEVEMLLND